MALLTLLVVPPHDLLANAWGGLQPWSDGVALVVAAGVLGWLFCAPAAVRVSAFRLPILLFSGVSVLSALVNHVPWETSLEGIRGMLPWMVGGLFAAATMGPEQLPKILKSAVWLGLLLALYGILSYLAFRSCGGWKGMPQEPAFWQSLLLYPYYTRAYEGWRLASTFLNDNYFGVWLAMLIPVAVALTLAETELRRRWVGYAVVTVMLVALTWTYSRAAALALLAAVVVLTWKVSRRAPLLLLPVLIAAPLMAIPQDHYRFQHVTRTAGGRVESLQRTGSALSSNLLLGKGPGTRGLADVNYAKIGYESGALGLVIFVWLLVVAVKPALRGAKSRVGESSSLQGGLLAGVVAVMVAAIGGEVWETPPLAFYFWMLAGSISVLSVPRLTGLGTTLETRECTTRS